MEDLIGDILKILCYTDHRRSVLTMQIVLLTALGVGGATVI